MNKKSQDLQHVRRAKLAVDQELELSRTGNNKVSTYHQLCMIHKKLEEMEDTIIQDNIPPLPDRNRGMGHMISDSWPLCSMLGEAILLAEEAFINLLYCPGQAHKQ